MGVCSQVVHNGIGPWTPTWHLSPPQFRDNMSWTCFCCCWYLCANDSQLIYNLYDMQTQHILSICCWNFLVIHVLVARLPEYMNFPVFSNFGHILLARFIRTYIFFVLVNTHHQNILNTLEVRNICMYMKDSWNKYGIFSVLR